MALTIRATRLPADSRYARIMRVMRDSEQKRPRMRRIASRLGAWYAPLAIAMGTAGWIVSGNPGRFLAVVVIATPCPLLIAVPVAIIGAISLCAHRGIVINDPAILEQVGTCRTLIFDKTGTLTYGRPAVIEILCASGFGRQDVLRTTASLEQYSRHPLAHAVLESARRAGVSLEPAERVSERPGEGLTGVVRGRTVRITGRAKLTGMGVPLPPPAGGLECIVLIDGAYAATIRFRDEPRHETRSFVHHLRPRHRVEKVILLSGDRESEVRYLANQVGIMQVYAGKSPEEKVDIVEEETRLARTLFVGDGINDAPAMLAATVGVAFGSHSDVTAEAAGAVVMEASLSKVDELMHIGARLRAIALESALGGMALSFAGMVLALVGWLPPVAGALAQELIDLMVVANAVRMAFPPRELTDFSPPERFPAVVQHQDAPLELTAP